MYKTTPLTPIEDWNQSISCLKTILTFIVSKILNDNISPTGIPTEALRTTSTAFTKGRVGRLECFIAFAHQEFQDLNLNKKNIAMNIDPVWVH